MSLANSTMHSFICYLMFILLAAHLNKPGDSQFLEENASPNGLLISLFHVKKHSLKWFASPNGKICVFL